MHCQLDFVPRGWSFVPCSAPGGEFAVAPLVTRNRVSFLHLHQPLTAILISDLTPDSPDHKTNQVQMIVSKDR